MLDEHVVGGCLELSDTVPEGEILRLGVGRELVELGCQLFLGDTMFVESCICTYSAYIQDTRRVEREETRSIAACCEWDVMETFSWFHFR